jgi:prolyl oligopeptidase
MPASARSTIAFAALVLAAAGPPPTPTVDYSETLFGMSFADAYHWMEAGGPQFDAWMNGQSAYARRVLDSIPGRVPLLEQLHALDGGETRGGNVVLVNGQWSYAKASPEDPVSRIYARPASGGAERVLIDPSAFDAGPLAAEIDYWSVSPGARYVAYGISLGGAEVGTLRIRSVETGADLPESMDRTRYARPGWLDDNSFLYTRLPAPPPGGAQVLTGGHIFLHVLGTDPVADTQVFAPGKVPGHDVEAEYFFRAYTSPDSPAIVVGYDAGLNSSPMTVFAAARPKPGAVPTWRKVAGFDDEVRGVVVHGDQLYLRTTQGSPRQRIVRTPALQPDLPHARTVVPQGAGTIDAMTTAADALYVHQDSGGIGRLVRLPWNGKPGPVATPVDGAFIGLTANPGTPGVVLSMQGWLRSQTVYEYDPVSKRFDDTGIAPPSAVSFDDIDWLNVRARSSDGTMVPLTIVFPRGTTHDGRHPVLLYTYGAYGMTVDPAFNAMRRAWFDHGGIYAVAHVRGGGYLGQEWHQAGRLEKKQNSINDFIAAAEYLAHERWASPSTIAAMGVSAGGITVGNAIARRPDLFGAFLINVGLVNALRLGAIPIGPFNVGEFGACDTEDGVRILHAIDAYQQLRDGARYPGALISTGLLDTRISSWMPAKFAARLQAANTSGRPVLLRVDDLGGHGGGTREQAESELADTYSFILWQAGVPGFQPE